MTFEPRIGPGGRDDDITRVLRSIHAPPADAGYWDRLEARILSAIAEESDAWWTPYAGWVRAGLVAALLAAVAASVTLTRMREAQTFIAYETVVETPRTLSAQLGTQTIRVPEREATLRYVIDP